MAPNVIFNWIEYKLSDLDLPVDLLVQGNEGFGAGDALDLWYVFVEDLHQMLIVPTEHLDQDGPVPGGVVAFQYLGNLCQLFDGPGIRHGLVQKDPDIGHGSIAQYPGVDHEFGSQQQPGAFEFAQPLVD